MSIIVSSGPLLCVRAECVTRFEHVRNDLLRLAEACPVAGAIVVTLPGDLGEHVACEMPMVDGRVLEVIPFESGATDEYVLRALAQRHPGRDVLHIDSDVQPMPGWGEALMHAASSGVGAVSPLSPGVSPLDPFPAAAPDWMTPDMAGRWLADLTRAHVFDVALVLRACCWLDGRALAALASEAEAALARGPVERLRDAGWATVACDWAYAEVPPERRAHACWQGDAGLVALAAIHPPLGRMRHAFGEILARGPGGAPEAHPVLRPVQLHVTHSWGGGLGRWIRDICLADEVRHNLVLRSIGTWGAFGQRLALYEGPEMSVPLREWQLDEPIRSVATAHRQYRSILDEIVASFGVDVVIVSSVIGHALDALDTDRPTVVAWHDYFPYCPALVIRFDEVCERCDRGRLRACFAENPLNRFFDRADEPAWPAVRKRYAELMQSPRIVAVAPSASVIRHLRTLEPALKNVPARIVENGLDLVAEPVPFEAEGRLRLVILGSLAAHKGRAILEQALPALLERAELHVLGCGEEGDFLEGREGVRLRRHYQPEELPGLIAEIRPHCGLLLSIVPETFSYTLSELWGFGVPVIATRLGSFADRVRDGENGWLIDPTAGALVDAVHSLDSGRTLLDHAAAAIRAGQPQQSCASMVEAYHALVPLPPTSGRVGVLVRHRTDSERHGALHINTQLPFRLVIDDFLSYTAGKVRNSPRMGRVSRRVMIALLGGLRYVGRLRRR